MTTRRDKHGRWLPGASGNPTGRPRLGEAEREAALLLARGTPRAARRLLELVDDPDPRVALRAAVAVLARLPLEDGAEPVTGGGELSEQLRRLADRLGDDGE